MSEVLYADIAGLLAAGFPDPPAPEVLAIPGGVGMFYAGQTNTIYGDPESGKTWVALAAVAEALNDGRRAAVLDLDHNGARATVHRLRLLGVAEETLAALDRFRYAQPFDAENLADIVTDLNGWRAGVVVVDSIGELLPVMGLSSNSPDDYTEAHARVLKPLAGCGAAVITIDHLPKSDTARRQGPTGTAAKMRAIGGTVLRARIVTPLAPGAGGTVALHLAKDRHGGLRARLDSTAREPIAGVFQLLPAGGWNIEPAAPRPVELSKSAEIEHNIIHLLGTSPDTPAQSGNQIRAKVTGSNQAVNAALQVLVDQGTLTRRSGPRNAVLYELAKPATCSGDKSEQVGTSQSDTTKKGVA